MIPERVWINRESEAEHGITTESKIQNLKSKMLLG
jgi:hypothetical protein